MNAVERIGGDPAAIAQPSRQLTVIDRPPPERGFRKASTAAVIRNFLQQLLCVHCPIAGPSGPRSVLSRALLCVWLPGAADRTEPTHRAAVNHNPAHLSSGQHCGRSAMLCKAV